MLCPHQARHCHVQGHPAGTPHTWPVLLGSVQVETTTLTLKILFINVCIYVVMCLFIYFWRGEGREKERERNINVWLPLALPLLVTWPTTQARALTGNGTGDPFG